MRKILILGAGDAQTDAIEYCRGKGMEVTGCSYTTIEAGIGMLDHFENVDIKDRAAVLALAERCGAELVYSVGSDIAIPTAMEVSERLGLPHFVSQETADICFAKDRLRSFLGQECEWNLKYEVFCRAEQAAGWELFPAMMKPADSQGQRGCCRVNSADEIKENFDRTKAFSNCGKVIIEEYIDGPELSANAYMHEGELKLCFISDRLSYADYPGGIIREHRLPSSADEEQKQRIRELVSRTCSVLGIENGPCYFQIKLDPGGRPKLIEAAPRLDGCHIWRLIKKCCGIDLLDLTFRHLAGETLNIPETEPDCRGYSLSFMSRRPGTVFRREDFDTSGAEFVHYYYNDGDIVIKKNGYYEKCGYMIRRLQGRND